jgi:acyl-CoA dehydrogenase
MHEVARSSGGRSAASAIHINIFGPHPVVVFGTEEQRHEVAPRSSAASRKPATEPDAGLDTTSIKTRRADGVAYRVFGKKI